MLQSSFSDLPGSLRAKIGGAWGQGRKVGEGRGSGVGWGLAWFSIDFQLTLIDFQLKLAKLNSGNLISNFNFGANPIAGGLTQMNF